MARMLDDVATMFRRPHVAVLSATVFGLGIGEELWQQFLPKYLVALGAGGVAVGAFSSFRNLLDSVYQYPGGWLSDRIGAARALAVFTGTAAAGYAACLVAPSWWW